jgi:hypothetical protein
MLLSPTEFTILKTLVYFNLFNYPLTLFELWQNLPTTNTHLSTPFLLEEEIKKNKLLNQLLDFEDGFYFLKGKKNIITHRQINYREALKKFRRAKWIANFLKYIPFIRSIIICNSLAYANPSESSDIDFLILVEPGSIWRTRALSILLTEIFASRPKKNKTKDAICLSFFSIYSQNFESLKLQPEDSYFDWWMTKLLPIYDREKTFEKFEESNRWINKLRPNALLALISKRFRIKEIRPGLRKILEILLSFPSPRLGERISQTIQMWHLPKELKEIANRDTRVVLNNNILKFHLNDRRDYYQKQLESQLKNIIASCG